MYSNTDKNVLPRLLAHHNSPGTPLHPSVDFSLCLFNPFLPSLSHLLFHQADMQQDRQLGIPPLSPCLAFLTRSLSESLLSFFLSSPPSIPVSLITIQQTAAVESAERWHTIPQSWNRRHTLPVSPLPLSHFLFSAQSSSLAGVTQLHRHSQIITLTTKSAQTLWQPHFPFC